VILIAAVLSLAAGLDETAAQDEPQATEIELSAKPALDDRGHPLKGQYAIVAIVTTADGRYVAKRAVQFVETVEFFGRRSAQLGSAVTDGTGYAAVLYQPSQTGQHIIVARLAGDKQYAASEVKFTLDATEVVPPFTEQPLPLAPIGRWLSISLAVLGVAFWAVLLGVLGRTAWRIRTAPGADGGVTPAAGLRAEEVPM
jgi:hypothetical protein